MVTPTKSPTSSAPVIGRTPITKKYHGTSPQARSEPHTEQPPVARSTSRRTAKTTAYHTTGKPRVHVFATTAPYSATGTKNIDAPSTTEVSGPVKVAAAAAELATSSGKAVTVTPTPTHRFTRHPPAKAVLFPDQTARVAPSLSPCRAAEITRRCASPRILVFVVRRVDGQHLFT